MNKHEKTLRQVHVKHRDRRRREVLKKVHYGYHVGGAKPVRVMKGFVSDGASIPRALWSIVGCPDTFTYEALAHDWLYMTHECSREDADFLFYVLLIDGGVNKFRARAMYHAVRLAGRWAWERGEDGWYQGGEPVRW